MKTLKVSHGADVAVKLSHIPSYKCDTLVHQTYAAVERLFALPGVQEDYEKWLIEYNKVNRQYKKQ